MPTPIQEYALSFVAENEGGWSNNVNDPGGATKLGVSLRLLRSLGCDIDGDGDVDEDDVRGITPDRRDELFLREFWRPEFNDYPYTLATRLFDHAVVAGPKASTVALQHAINAASALVRLNVDGAFGQRTDRAAREFFPLARLGVLVTGYRCARIGHFREIIARNPSLSVFANGWYARAVR